MLDAVDLNGYGSLKKVRLAENVALEVRACVNLPLYYSSWHG
jgi:hypothetical protein